MLQKVTRFFLLLLGVLGIVFLLHQYILSSFNLSKFGNSLILSYSVNALLAGCIVISILALKNKFKDQLGFVFMLGSLLKFAIFFIVFQPIYQADNVISKPEFFAFFIPYAVCLIIEVIWLSKWLNQLQ